MVSIILTVVLVLWTNLAWATIRYVSTTGSDSNSCAASETISTPKLTLVSAKACMVGGDELIIRGGTYTGSSNHLNSGIPSGTASAWTKYTAYPGEVPIIRPTLPTGTTFALQLFNDQYVQFTGLYINGSEVTRSTFKIGENSDHIIFQDGDITDGNKGRSSADWDVGSSCISGSGSPTSKSDDVQILRNVLHECGYNAFDHGIYPSYGDSWTIRGNEIYGMSGYGLHIYPYPTNWTIENNYIHDNCAMVDGSCSQVVLSESGHVFIHNIVEGRVSASSPNCVQIQYGVAGGDNMQVDNNTMYNCGTVGVYIGSTANNTKIRNNHIIGPTTAVSNNGTNTTQTTNRTTGSLTDCTVSTSVFSHKATSSCINAGTVISGRTYNGSAPDQGAFETFVFSSCEVPSTGTSTIRASFTNNLNPPLLPASSVTGVTGRKNGSSNVITASVRLGTNQIDFTMTNSYVGGDTVDISASSTNITDSALIGNTLNQPYVGTLTNQSCTNNAGGAPVYTYTQARYEFHAVDGAEDAPRMKPDGFASTGAAENFTSLPVRKGGAVRLRFALLCGGADCPSTSFFIYASSGGAYALIPDTFGSENVAMCGTVASTPNNAAPSTNQLSTAGTFAAGGYVNTSNAVPEISGLLNGYKTEIEYCVKFDTDATGTYTFRVYTQSGVALDTYTVTPTVTITESKAGMGF